MANNQGEHQGLAIGLLGDLVKALSNQRQALVGSDWRSLAEVIPRLQDVVSAISNFPGGIEGVRGELSKVDPTTREELDGLLASASVDRKTATELIRINLQRYNALRSIHSLSDEQDTYGQDATSPRPGLKLSTRV